MTKRKLILLVILEILSIIAVFVGLQMEKQGDTQLSIVLIIFGGILAVVLPIFSLRLVFEDIGIKISKWLNKK